MTVEKQIYEVVDIRTGLVVHELASLQAARFYADRMDREMRACRHHARVAHQVLSR